MELASDATFRIVWRHRPRAVDDGLKYGEVVEGNAATVYIRRLILLKVSAS